MPYDRDALRARRLIRQTIAKYAVDLNGLTVFTEAASGPYRFTPMLCALAGADRVFGLAQDTRWGGADETIARARVVAGGWGVAERIDFVTSKRADALAQADIVTNSGNVRPIDGKTVAALKPTCVVPLMWETWEFRADELDLPACREKGVLVMGTDEEAMDYRWFTGMVHLRALLLNGLEVHGNRVLVLSSDPVRRAICRMLEANGADFRWTSLEGDPGREYRDRYIVPTDRTELLAYASEADACICDDRRELGTLIGSDGLFSAGELTEVNPGIVVLNRSGIVDYAGLKAAGIRVSPDREAHSNYPNMTAADLGMLPIIELTAAGLKVGEVMARARLSGMDVREAAQHALSTSLAHDFSDDLAWAGGR